MYENKYLADDLYLIFLHYIKHFRITIDRDVSNVWSYVIYSMNERIQMYCLKIIFYTYNCVSKRVSLK